MTAYQAIETSPPEPGPVLPSAKASGDGARIADDMVMLRAAVELTRDISEARPGIYWPDMLGSAVTGYAALAGAVLFENPVLAAVSGIVAALALYRALLFIHELTHIHRDALPGFRLVWNLLGLMCWSGEDVPTMSDVTTQAVRGGGTRAGRRR